MVCSRETAAFWYEAYQQAKQELMTTRKQRERKRDESKKSTKKGLNIVPKQKPLKKQAKDVPDDAS